MLKLRIACDATLTPSVLDALERDPRVALLTLTRAGSIVPRGDLITVACASDVVAPIIRRLGELGLPPHGVIEVSSLIAVIGRGPASTMTATDDDAVVWEEVVARAGEESASSPTYLILMALAGVIAAIGILTNNVTLIVGAMIVSPDFGPVVALSVGLAEGRRGRIGASLAAVVVGFAVASLAGLSTGLVFGATGQIPTEYQLGVRPIVELITHPTWGGIVVALSAGIAGVIALGQAKSGALVGVLVSVTTIPAASNIGVALASGSVAEAAAAAVQLVLNLLAIVLGGTGALLAVRWANGRSTLRRQPPVGPAPTGGKT